MAFGVTDNGFIIKRLSDILEEIEEDLQTAFGNVDTSASSVFGQLAGTFSNQLAEAWEQLQKSYNAMSPNLASNVTLDFNVALNGLTRLKSLPTEVEVGLNGTNGSIIPSDTQISSTVDGEVFSLQNDTEITPDSQNILFIVVDDVQNNTLYSITINISKIYSYTSSGSATADEIAQGLVDDITADPASPVTPEKFPNGVIKLVTKDASFDTVYSSNLVHYNISQFKSVNTGEILAVSNTLNIIDTPVSGLDNVNNFEDGIKGRGPETDAELRLRLSESFQIAGAGTLDSIIARLRDDVEDVTDVRGFENRTDITDGEGRPPHSFEMVVVGGTDEDIGNKIWLTKPAGINTFGNTFYDITDSNGDLQRMYFSRPVDQYAWIIADLTLYSEEDFPVDGVDQVKNKILEHGESLGIGVDIIPGRFYGPIYEIPGIDTIAIQIAITPTELGTPVYQTTTIPIAANEISVWDLSRITVNVP